MEEGRYSARGPFVVSFSNLGGHDIAAATFFHLK